MNRPFVRDITKVCECTCTEKCDHNATKMRPSFISGEPLTLEQLRQMDGKPVWVQNLEEPEKSQWRLCHWDRGKYLVLQGIYVQGYLEEDYGESWIAYAYPPAYIDLEAWEPCSKCRSCASCLSSTESVKHYPCLQCERYENFSPRNFCPECGRPLTPEARAMLEKRLRGF